MKLEEEAKKFMERKCKDIPDELKKTIEEIEKKLNEQGMVADARLENHLDNLNQIAFELIKKEKKDK